MPRSISCNPYTTMIAPTAKSEKRTIHLIVRTSFSLHVFPACHEPSKIASPVVIRLTHYRNKPRRFATKRKLPPSLPLANRGRESPNKLENILIGVVQGHGCNSESIRLAPVTDDACLGQPFTPRPPVLGEPDRKLCAAPLLFVRCDDRELWRCLLIEQELQIARQRHAFGP